MTGATARATYLPPATAGELAVANLESSLERAWQVLRRFPDRPGTAEHIVDAEQQRAQFLGDVSAVDRLVGLVSERCARHPAAPDTHLIAAQVAAMRHHFADARMHLATAVAAGASQRVAERIRLTVDQATGENLPAVLAARQVNAYSSGALVDLVPLASLLADLGEFAEADRNYAKALLRYRDVSPFALAWACFQRGVLWGESVPAPDPDRAARWYGAAIDYVPAYPRARVHLAEIRLEAGALADAEALLRPVVAVGDPEVRWRLAQVLLAQGRIDEAEGQLDTAREAFEALIARHELAFADHAAEFLLGSGSDPGRACELARINLANRPTLRAFLLAHEAALASRDEALAAALVARASSQWGHTKAFALTPLATPFSPSDGLARSGTGR